MLFSRLVLACSACAFAQVPDTGTHHDHRSSYLELGVSMNTGYPEVARPQIELLAKHRGWPFFVSGRLAVGAGDWAGTASMVITPQLALHYTSDGDDSWAIRLGAVEGVNLVHAEVDCDSSTTCEQPNSSLTGGYLAVERTTYSVRWPSLGWRASLGAAGYTRRSARNQTKPSADTGHLSPYVDLGLIWMCF